MSLIKIVAFNNSLKELFSFLKKTFPTEKKLITYEFQIKMIIDANPNCIYNMFREHVLKYKEQVRKYDENFILHELKKVCGDNNVEFLDFNSIWKKKENKKENKIKIFQYLIKMINLVD